MSIDKFLRSRLRRGPVRAADIAEILRPAACSRARASSRGGAADAMWATIRKRSILIILPQALRVVITR